MLVGKGAQRRGLLQRLAKGRRRNTQNQEVRVVALAAFVAGIQLLMLSIHILRAGSPLREDDESLFELRHLI